MFDLMKQPAGIDSIVKLQELPVSAQASGRSWSTRTTFSCSTWGSLRLYSTT